MSLCLPHENITSIDSSYRLLTWSTGLMAESQTSFSHCCRPCFEDRSSLSPREPLLTFSRVKSHVFQQASFTQGPIFTIHTCSYIQEHFSLAPFNTCHTNGGIDGARDSPAGGDNATLMDANCHKNQQKKKKIGKSWMYVYMARNVCYYFRNMAVKELFFLFVVNNKALRLRQLLTNCRYKQVISGVLWLVHWLHVKASFIRRT